MGLYLWMKSIRTDQTMICTLERLLEAPALILGDLTQYPITCDATPSFHIMYYGVFFTFATKKFKRTSVILLLKLFSYGSLN